MKRVVFLLVVVVFVTPIFAQTPGPEQTPKPASPLLGDINFDLTVDIVDALNLAQYYVGKCDCVSDPVTADVNLDGTIDIIDALLIAQFYVGLITSLPPNATPIEDYRWTLQSFGDRNNPVPILTGTQIFLWFNPDMGQASGDAGCNGYTGNYVIDGNNISLYSPMSTLMACMDPPGIMDQEMDYLSALSGAETYIVNQDTLTIYSSENRVLIFHMYYN